MHKFASWRIQKIGLHLIDISPILAQKFQVFLPVCKSNFHQPADSFPLKNGLSENKVKSKIHLSLVLEEGFRTEGIEGGNSGGFGLDPSTYFIWTGSKVDAHWSA